MSYPLGIRTIKTKEFKFMRKMDEVTTFYDIPVWRPQ